MHRRPALLLTLAAVAAVAAGCASGSAPVPTVPGTTAPASGPSSTTPTSPRVTVTPAVNDTTVVTSPLDGTTVTGPTVTVTGEATAFEGELSWLVYRAGGDAAAPAQHGTTTTGANGAVAPFEITVELEPGAWVVQVFEASPKDGTPLRPVAVTFAVS